MDKKGLDILFNGEAIRQDIQSKNPLDYKALVITCQLDYTIYKVNLNGEVFYALYDELMNEFRLQNAYDDIQDYKESGFLVKEMIDTLGFIDKGLLEQEGFDAEKVFDKSVLLPGDTKYERMENV